ncbi:MAG: serine/threonine-protein kinase [Streptosporangiaceae bacterium]
MVAGSSRLIAGQYRLIEKVGRGGFGVVWRAHDEQLDRVVAAKELFLPAYLAEGQRQERRTRSLREARSAARLDHRGAVRVYDVVEHDDGPWIIMEFIQGRSLEDVIKEDGPLPAHEVAEIGLQILDALRSAHEAGVIHRDVKPSNVLLGDDGRAVLTDFGIATIEGDVSITQSGFVMGAPAYTSPERARGEQAKASSDLWSLGATLYYAVEGGQPFAGSNANQVFHSIITGPPGPIERAGLLEPLIIGLLQKDSEQRLTASDAALLLAGAAQQSDPDRIRTLPNRRNEPDRTEPKPHPKPHPKKPRKRRSLYPLSLLAALTAVVLIWNLQSDETPARIKTTAQKPQPYSLLDTIPIDGQAINAVAFSPDSTQLAIANQTNVLRVWNVRTKHIERQLTTGSSYLVSVAFSPDGQRLATGDYSGEVRVFPASGSGPPRVLPGDLRNVRMLSFSPKGGTLAVASDNLRVWKYGSAKKARDYGTDGGLFAVAYQPTSGQLAFAQDERVRLGGRLLIGSGSLVTWLAYSPDGSRLAVADQDGRVRMYDVRSRRLLYSFPGNDHTANAVAFSADNSRIAVAAGNEVVIWDTETHTSLVTLVGGLNRLNTVAFSPDGRLVAAAGDDAKLRTWLL